MFAIEKIEAAAAAGKLQPAVISGEKELTYGELWEKSDALSVYLEEVLGEDKTPLVVYGHKDPMMLVCFLACVKSGRAYCPVDMSMPAERVRDIAETVGNRLVIGVEKPESLPEGMQVLSREDMEKAINARLGERFPESKWVKPDDTFYIIFTSGSTGKPKGVQISAQALTRFTDWSETLGGSPEEKRNAVFLNQAPFSFDLSVMDVYTALTTGATLFCLDKETVKDMGRLTEALGRGNINYWVSTPSFADMCLSDKVFNDKLISDLKAFLFCGEKLTKTTAARLMERFPKARIVNTYGPTESTVAVTGTEITKEMLEAEGELPIGYAKAGTEIEIDGESGEIVIVGDTVSKGYYKDSERTVKAFGRKADGRLYYRTGDQGYMKDGMLYYHGRLDLQVKLHGYRIELGDIECNIGNICGISAAAVIPKYQDGKVKHLTAFVVRDDKEEFREDTGARLAASREIKAKLKETLPEYMVPKRIVFTDGLPMTGNGKTDRRKLEALV